MSKRYLIAAISVLSVFVPGVAAAQSQPGGTSETGTLINRRSAQIHGESRADARLTSKRFGECSLARAPVAAVQLIDAPVDGPDYDRLIKRVIVDDCLSVGELSLPHQVIRGSLFEALYIKEFGHRAPTSLKDVPTFDYSSGYSRPLSGEALSVISLAVVGDCVARSAPIAAHELITSIPGSGIEDRAVAVVARLLPGCIPPKQTVKFSRSVMRASVAEAMYRLSGINRAIDKGDE